MESPRVGVVRESMLHRPLLIKVRTDIDGFDYSELFNLISLHSTI